MLVKTRLFLCILMFVSVQFQTYSCTIFSGKDNQGQMWAGNNEDYLFTFNTNLSIVPSTSQSFGYLYYTYNNPKLDQQGGVNDAGLFFDFNYLDNTRYSKGRKKKYYPGGTFKLFEHILKHCSTVQEVVDLFKEYRLDNLANGQLHIADQYGNLALIAGDNIKFSSESYQVSTNYNACIPNQDSADDPCWRMPIAQRILQSNEPSFKTFSQICDSTHQFYRDGFGTIYSNIYNLSTGEMWLYHGANYSEPYKTSLNELFQLGDTTIKIHDLFNDSPLVRAFTLCEEGAYEEAIETVNSVKDNENRTKTLSFLAMGLIEMGGMFNAYQMFDLYLSEKEPSTSDIVNKSIALYCIGEKELAIKTLNTCLQTDPDNPALIQQKKRINGLYNKSCNYRIELQGYSNATNVVIDNFLLTKTNGFMTREGDKWVIELPLGIGKFHYAFFVDGERIVHPDFDISDFNGIRYNIENVTLTKYLGSHLKKHRIR